MANSEITKNGHTFTTHYLHSEIEKQGNWMRAEQQLVR